MVLKAVRRLGKGRSQHVGPAHHGADIHPDLVRPARQLAAVRGLPGGPGGTTDAGFADFVRDGLEIGEEADLFVAGGESAESVAEVVQAAVEFAQLRCQPLIFRRQPLGSTQVDGLGQARVPKQQRGADQDGRHGGRNLEQGVGDLNDPGGL